jgi:hypothetical protein
MDVNSVTSYNTPMRMPSIADIAAIMSARSASQLLAQQAAVAAIAAADAASLAVARAVSGGGLDLYL